MATSIKNSRVSTRGPDLVRAAEQLLSDGRAADACRLFEVSFALGHRPLYAVLEYARALLVLGDTNRARRVYDRVAEAVGALDIGMTQAMLQSMLDAHRPSYLAA